MATTFRCFEDYEIGQEGVTSSRTIGEAAINTFAYITCDFGPAHMDRHAAAGSIYGERVAHGLLGSCLAEGMISQTAPHIVGRGVLNAFLSGFETNYRRAIVQGDTIRIQWRVSQMSDTALHGFGVVSTSFAIVNQDDIPVYIGSFNLTVRKRSAGDAKPRLEASTPWKIKPFMLDPDKIYHLEDYIVGDGEESGGRTMTEADIVNFSGFTGDINPLYVDSVFAGQGVFGERVVPPMMVFSTILPLVNMDGDIIKSWMDPRAQNWAGHLADGANFLLPVKIGDTLRCRFCVQSVRPSKTKPHLGVLRLGAQIVNQRNEVVQEGHVTMSAATRAGVAIGGM